MISKLDLRRVSFFFFLCSHFCFVPTFAATYFQIDSTSKEVYPLILSLQLNNAKDVLLKRFDSDNLINQLFLDYIHFFDLYFNGNKTKFKEQLGREQQRLQLIDLGPDNSPWKKYCKAEVYIHWAILKMKFGDYPGAIWDIRKAKVEVDENRLRFPSFQANIKPLALLECLFGSIPDQFKWGGSLFGLEGDVKMGLNMYEKLLSQSSFETSFFAEEIKLTHALVLFHLSSNPEKAWVFMNKENIPWNKHLLSYYVFAHISVYGGHSKALINASSKTIWDENFIKIPHLMYLQALALTYAQAASAEKQWNSYLSTSTELSYRKSALQKLAWIYFLTNNIEKYKEVMNRVFTEGEAVIDADKQAFKEAQKGILPNQILLKARLLCDGGYYEEGIHLLTSQSQNESAKKEEVVEYFYRLARLQQLNGNKDEAITHYLKSYQTGDNSLYYSAASVYQLGIIYEEKKNFDEARKYYKLCLTMKDHEYVYSLSQKAKAGLNRIQ